eukprot:1112879_1
MNMEFIFEDNIDNMISFDIYADEERESMESALGVAGSDCENCKDELHRLIQQLKHELGECLVEWGSCEQLGRAKDKLEFGICVLLMYVCNVYVFVYDPVRSE